MRTLLSVLAIAFSAAALAQAPAFEEVDTNADGVIDRDEAAAIEGFDFDTADTNQDGVVDRQEYDASMGGGDIDGGELPPLE